MGKQICICVPSYNSEKTIYRTLTSLITQTYENLVIHLVDNASTDDTVNIARSIDDDRIRVHVHKQHLNKAEHNWNSCFLYMPIDTYSAIFHADDIYYPKMIEKQVNILDTHGDVGAVFTGSNCIDSDDTVKYVNQLPEPYTHNNELTKREILLSTLRYGNQLMTPTPLYRSNIYKLLAPFKYESFGYSSDLDMWLRTSKNWNLFVINEPLMGHRSNDLQWSKRIHNQRTSEEMFFRTVDYHIDDITDIPQNILDMYELRRFEDKLTCIKNLIKTTRKRFPNLLLNGLKIKMGLIK